MHQAIEAKEGVEIKQENQTLATVTLQNYFRLYGKLSGMTGTAQTEAAEFNKVYSVGVISIPTHRPMIRADRPDVIYKTEKAKFQAVVEDIAERHAIGQPVLVGTVSVENSEILSQLLRRKGVAHNVLNAKYHAREAEIIAQAGRKAGVTVATNMAGRGTDILLGGNPEFLAAAELRQRGITEEEHGDAYYKELEEITPRWEEFCSAEAEEVVSAGGLYVLGTERHESRRIDNQLRGRSGRQGDPGESRFYLSLQDELMRRFRSGAVEAVMDRFNIPEDVPIESKMVSKQIKSAQTQIEAQNAEIRKNVLKYDEVMNKQRQVVYAERRRVLDGEDLNDQITRMIDDVVTAYVRGATVDSSGEHPEEWDLDQLWTNLKQLYPVGVTIEDLEAEADAPRTTFDVEFLTEHMKEDAHKAYKRREESLPHPDAMRMVERQILLAVIDRKWREHLYEMDYLQEGVGLRAYAQRDPLVEYQREGFDMFSQMMEGIKEEAVGFLFNADVQVGEAEPAPAKEGMPLPAQESAVEVKAKGFGQRSTPRTLQYTSPTIDGAAGGGAKQVQQGSALGLAGAENGKTASAQGRKPSPRRNAPPVGTVTAPASRNSPCPCGSGKKYKRCHGATPGGE
jgi:preprotein translocase subunit SecA